MLAAYGMLVVWWLVGFCKSRSVRDFVARTLGINAATFALATPMPRRVYSTADELHLTLKQADLVPRAVLLVQLAD